MGARYPLANTKKETWGTPQDIQILESHFEEVAAWSAQHRVPVLLGARPAQPVLIGRMPPAIGEFGANGSCESESRTCWMSEMANGAIRRGFAFTAWCDGPEPERKRVSDTALIGWV